MLLSPISIELHFALENKMISIEQHFPPWTCAELWSEDKYGFHKPAMVVASEAKTCPYINAFITAQKKICCNKKKKILDEKTISRTTIKGPI